MILLEANNILLFEGCITWFRGPWGPWGPPESEMVSIYSLVMDTVGKKKEKNCKIFFQQQFQI